MSYVYIKSEPQLWTVGFYSPDGKWHPESDHASTDAAADRVAYLNGSKRKLCSGISEALNSGYGVYRP